MMRKSGFLLVFLLCSTGFTVTLRAQGLLLSSSAAKIGTELSIVETAALHFGTMTKPTSAVNVVLTPVNNRTATVPSAITLLPQAPLSSPAAYILYGSKNAHYLVTLPANNTVLISNGSSQMNIDSFTILTTNQGGGSSTGKLNNQGTDTFRIGATLKLSNGQPAGIYTGTFSITVNYN